MDKDYETAITVTVGISTAVAYTPLPVQLDLLSASLSNRTPTRPAANFHWPVLLDPKRVSQCGGHQAAGRHVQVKATRSRRVRRARLCHNESQRSQ